MTRAGARTRSRAGATARAAPRAARPRPRTRSRPPAAGRRPLAAGGPGRLRLGAPRCALSLAEGRAGRGGCPKRSARPRPRGHTSSGPSDLAPERMSRGGLASPPRREPRVPLAWLAAVLAAVAALLTVRASAVGDRAPPRTHLECACAMMAITPALLTAWCPVVTAPTPAPHPPAVDDRTDLRSSRRPFHQFRCRST